MFYFKILLFAFVSLGYGLSEDYFWREYTGTIPADAVVAGSNKDGQNIYMGQTYIPNVGIVVSQIDQESRSLIVPGFGVVKKKNMYIKFFKILCGLQENFSWVSTNSTSLHLILIDKHAVIGGHQDGRGILNIGRVSDEGEIKIGKVLASQAGNSSFYFSTSRDKEHQVDSYEVLVYSKNKFDI